MPYINVDLDYFEHPKTLLLIGILGPGAAELPLRLWAFCGKFRPKDGQLAAKNASEVEALIRWWGKPGKAAAALQRTGFLAKGSRGFSVHDWKSHQGHIWALKMRNAAVAKNRWANIRKQASLVDTSGIPKSTTSIPFPSFPSKGSRPALPAASKSKRCAITGCGIHKQPGKEVCPVHLTEGVA